MYFFPSYSYTRYYILFYVYTPSVINYFYNMEKPFSIVLYMCNVGNIVCVFNLWEKQKVL